MKKQFRPIAMRCNEEQFEAIKPKLERIGKIGLLFRAFKKYKYLNNNYGPKEVSFDFVGSEGYWIREHKNNIHEQWNEKVFLEACGIETEPEFVISKEQILELCSYGNTESRLKQWFPSAFETVLEVGKWYKAGKSLFNHQESKNSYGFRFGKWQDGNWSTKQEYFDDTPVLATESEVFEALKTEAVKRYKVGDYINCLYSKQSDISAEGTCVASKERFYLDTYGQLWMYSSRIKNIQVFNSGEWATVVDPITKEQAEKELGKKIIW